jgi:hypothetical protein
MACKVTLIYCTSFRSIENHGRSMLIIDGNGGPATIQSSYAKFKSLASDMHWNMDSSVICFGQHANTEYEQKLTTYQARYKHSIWNQDSSMLTQ